MMHPRNPRLNGQEGAGSWRGVRGRRAGGVAPDRGYRAAGGVGQGVIAAALEILQCCRLLANSD